MEWAEKIEEFRALRAALPEFIEQMSVVIPATALADVRGRIQESGTDAEGKPLKEYSTRPLPTSYFTGPEADPQLSQSAASKYPSGISYLDYKKEVGRYTGKTDLTLTTRMWNNTHVVSEEVGEDGFIVTIAGGNDETQAKLDANSERYGDVLGMSEEEVDGLAVTFDDELQRFVELHVTSDE